MIWLAGNIRDSGRIVLPSIWAGVDRIESPDTGEIMLGQPILLLFMALRERYGRPIRITSGYRTAAYQAHLRASGAPTAAGLSPHQLGMALDITGTSPDSIDQLLQLLTWVPASVSLPAPRVGVEAYGKAFLHVDYVFMLYGHWPGAEYDEADNPHPESWREGVRW